jgi:hypothetical protein
LERKLEAFKDYYNHNRFHASLDGDTPAKASGEFKTRKADLECYRWQAYCRGLVKGRSFCYSCSFPGHGSDSVFLRTHQTSTGMVVNANPVKVNNLRNAFSSASSAFGAACSVSPSTRIKKSSARLFPGFIA